MTTLDFRNQGYRRLTSPSTFLKVLDYIKNTKMEADVTLDLRGCIFSYPLARILEAVVSNLAQQGGVKNITICHGYSTATQNHLIPYLTKKTTIFSADTTTLDKLKSTLRDSHQIELKILGSDNE
jgi:hypothetical protein